MADGFTELARVIIARERERQITVEGFNAAHDRALGPLTLRTAARAYLYGPNAALWPNHMALPFKPRTHVDNLVRGGALALAALDIAPEGQIGTQLAHELHADTVRRLAPILEAVHRYLPPQKVVLGVVESIDVDVAHRLVTLPDNTVDATYEEVRPGRQTEQVDPPTLPQVATTVEDLRALDPVTAVRTEGGLLVEAGQLIRTIEQGPFSARDMAALPATILWPSSADEGKVGYLTAENRESTAYVTIVRAEGYPSTLTIAYGTNKNTDAPVALVYDEAREMWIELVPALVDAIYDTPTNPDEDAWPQ